MKLTIDAASKMIRTLNTELLRLATLENNNNQIDYLEGEEKFVPEYDIEAHQAELDRINGNIQKIKHSINVFNCGYVLPDLGITIDVALVRMAVLNKRVGELNRMRNMPKKSRATSLRGEKAQYTEPNFDTDVANKLYEQANNQLIEIQSALNLANITNEIEVELD